MLHWLSLHLYVHQMQMLRQERWQYKHSRLVPGQTNVEVANKRIYKHVANKNETNQNKKSTKGPSNPGK